MEQGKQHNTTRIAVAGIVLVALILVLGALWLGRAATEVAGGAADSGTLIVRGAILAGATVLALAALFIVLLKQIRINARLTLEKQTAEAENRARHEALEQQLQLQAQLLEQEQQRTQQSKLISALAADYWGAYYIDLDRNEGVCYQVHDDLDEHLSVNQHFPYLESVTAYAEKYVVESSRADFLRFVQPDAIRAGLAAERVISTRYLVHRHGRDRYEMVRFAGVRHPEDRDDHVVHAVGACFTDVDAETRATLERAAALSDALAAAEQANLAKNSFLSNMSHEIRTPMNAIIGLDSIALNDPETPEKLRGYLEKIGASADHLLRLINDILDMSRIESGRMTLKTEEFSFPRLLESVNTILSSQCAEKGLTYHCYLKNEVAERYVGDSAKLRQVLLNILDNAVKFTPRGGAVSFTVERVAGFDRRSTLRFTVEDTGIGMSADYLPRLFDPFSQENISNTSPYGSSGLGMPIARSIVEMMNGSIDVKSEKGVGTCFTVCVTLTDAEPEARQDATVPHPEALRVLLAEGDPVARESARQALEKAGIAAETVESGASAVEQAQLRFARRAPYDLILLDRQMPDMDGLETARRIRALSGGAGSVILLMAYGWDEDRDEALRAGVDSFVPKPLFAEQALEEYRAVMEHKSRAVTQAARKADLNGRRVLLAEDVPVNAEIIQMVLLLRGMESDHAENGRLCVEMFAAREPGYYDAVLMDMRMPEMDGLEATRAIRAMDRPDAARIPIIALTANAFDEDVQRSLQAGLNAHLSKPVQPDTLYETLESLIED